MPKKKTVSADKAAKQQNPAQPATPKVGGSYKQDGTDQVKLVEQTKPYAPEAESAAETNPTTEPEE